MNVGRGRGLLRDRFCLAIALAVSAVAGCGSSSSSTYVRGVYSDGSVRYRIGEPGAGWTRIAVEDNDLAFEHRTLGTMAVNSTCEDYSDVPEQALMNHLLFGTRQRKYLVEEMETLDGRGAWHVVVELELDGVPVTLEVYLVKKDGCVYDLTRISSRPAFEPGRADFRHLVVGFSVLSTRLE